jgi:hypothetical protein
MMHLLKNKMFCALGEIKLLNEYVIQLKNCDCVDVQAEQSHSQFFLNVKY